MSKSAIFTMKLERQLRTEFITAVAKSHRSASQVVRELMWEFIQREQDRRGHSAFLHTKVKAAGASADEGLGQSNEAVSAEFAARRTPITDWA